MHGAERTPIWRGNFAFFSAQKRTAFSRINRPGTFLLPGSRSIEELFLELVRLSNSLDEEAERHVRENLSEKELVIFDILTRPAPELSADERTEVKKVAKDLLGRLKALLVLSWRQKVAARSQIRLAIEDTLDGGLPRAYTPELYNQKCSAVFEHVYEKFPQQSAGV